jgi:hypothetical protein
MAIEGLELGVEDASVSLLVLCLYAQGLVTLCRYVSFGYTLFCPRELSKFPITLRAPLRIWAISCSAIRGPKELGARSSHRLQCETGHRSSQESSVELGPQMSAHTCNLNECCSGDWITSQHPTIYIGLRDLELDSSQRTVWAW